MNRIIRQKDRDIYIFEKILIPVEIAIVSILFGTGNMKDSTDLISFLCVTSFCIGFLEHEILNLKESVYFLKTFLRFYQIQIQFLLRILGYKEFTKDRNSYC